MSVMPDQITKRNALEKQLRADLEEWVRAELEKITGQKLYVKVQSSTVIHEALVPMGDKFGLHIVVSAHPKKEEAPK